ncbi:MAG: DUF2437 domain-containing protein, partial [Chloroflexi bacterium]|nr:DUF2437 domain-containing protein [Chloroflexota bacterium]
MRWVRYEADGNTSYGILNGEKISEVSGSPFETYSETGTTRSLDSVKLLIPFEPKTFYAA